MAISDAGVTALSPHHQMCSVCGNEPWLQENGICLTCGRFVPEYQPQDGESNFDQFMVCPLLSARHHTSDGGCPICLGQGVIPIDMGDSLIGFLLRNLSAALPPPPTDNTTKPIGMPYVRAVTCIFADAAHLYSICNDSGDYRLYVEPARNHHGYISSDRLDVWLQDKCHPVGPASRSRILHCGTALDVAKYISHHLQIAADQWRPRPF